MGQHAYILQLVSRVEDVVLPALLFKTEHILHQVLMDLDLHISSWKIGVGDDLAVLRHLQVDGIEPVDDLLRSCLFIDDPEGL